MHPGYKEQPGKGLDLRGKIAHRLEGTCGVPYDWPVAWGVP
jgi:hypothetical protein